MPEAQNNVPILHRKEWQTMMPAPAATVAGAFVISGGAGNRRYSLYMVSATVHYLYDHFEDDWLPIASGAFGGTFGAGACGTHLPWSPAYTATGGTTTSLTVNSATHNIIGYVVGDEIEFLTLTAGNIGLRRTITAIETNIGTGTITITFNAAPSSVANNDTFRISSGSFFVLCAGTLAATSFKRYDIATGTWSSLTQTGLPATWGTDGRLVSPYLWTDSYDSGTATSGSTTTLVCSGKNWTADQWINYQVRITAGTGVGQKSRITDNTTDTLTFAAGATIDSTSQFVIEGDENAIYALGNNAVTMYKYSISGNSWATVAPTVARAGAPIAGMSADWVGETGDTNWADITDIKDGRYIYSLRGGTAVMDRFDISGGTAGAGAWTAVTYQPSLQTFATGDSTEWSGKFLYIAKEGTAAIPQRFYKYDLIGNTVFPMTSDWYFGGAAVLGNKIWIKNLSTSGLVKWLYCLQSTSTNLRRIMIF
ncbi:MAG: hypothetical protein VW879_03665 [Opitutae bacterium]